MVNAVKYGKYTLARFAKFVIFVLRRPKFTGSGKAFPCVIPRYKKFADIEADIFRILPHFATKLGNFTNLNMLFAAVVRFSSFCQNEASV